MLNVLENALISERLLGPLTWIDPTIGIKNLSCSNKVLIGLKEFYKTFNIFKIVIDDIVRPVIPVSTGDSSGLLHREEAGVEVQVCELVPL